MNKKSTPPAEKRSPKKLSVEVRRQQVLTWHESGASIREIAGKLIEMGYKVCKSTVENDLQAIYRTCLQFVEKQFLLW